MPPVRGENLPRASNDIMSVERGLESLILFDVKISGYRVSCRLCLTDDEEKARGGGSEETLLLSERGGGEEPVRDE